LIKKNYIFTVLDHLAVWPQYILPQYSLSRAIYYISRCRWRWFKDLIIKGFVRYFDVDTSQARQISIAAYPHFNAFFTRELKPAARPISDTGISCPVDGYISEIGDIAATKIIQAKGKSYDLASLLAHDEDMTGCFINGKFGNFYLSPRDYHRIHMPLDGVLTKMVYVPGRLFSVKQRTSRVVNNLFARNERVICLFETDLGPMAILSIGALFVASITMSWHGEIDPSKRTITEWSYQADERKRHFLKGAEMGHFNMGSTVILLFGPDKVNWNNGLAANTPIQVGQSIAQIVSDDSLSGKC